MSGLDSPFDAHFCDRCNEQCGCSEAVVEHTGEQVTVTGCTHDCDTAELERNGTYKPGHSGGFPF